MTAAQSNNDGATASLLTPRKIAIQLIGWTIGIALLAWVIKGAVAKGDWTKVVHADPWLIAALIGCTVISTIMNGTTFWITIQPIRAVRWRDMQFLNIVANMLNYAPVRLGVVARVMYHLRVDRLNLLQIGAWFAMISYILFLGVAACFLATMVHDQIDWIWLVIVLGQMIVGGAVARFMAGNRLVARYGSGLGGVDQIFTNPAGLWGAIACRIIDLGAYAGRMAAALAILDVHLASSHTVVLALVALAASLMPVGKAGFREFCVAAAAARLNMQSSAITGTWEQLALIESAGEALFFIPLGAAMLLWYRKRWIGSNTQNDAAEASDVNAQTAR